MFFRTGKAVRVTIQANVEWAFAQDPASGEWIGVCEPLNLNAMGDTFAELQQCASEAMHLLFLDLFRDGELDAFLKEHGWTPHSPLPEKDSNPHFDTSYRTRLARVRELLPA